MLVCQSVCLSVCLNENSLTVSNRVVRLAGLHYVTKSSKKTQKSHLLVGLSVGLSACSLSPG